MVVVVENGGGSRRSVSLSVCMVMSVCLYLSVCICVCLSVLESVFSTYSSSVLDTCLTFLLFLLLSLSL